MNVKITPPPELNGKDNLRELEAWLRTLAVLVNLGFSSIGIENLNDELKNVVERGMIE